MNDNVQNCDSYIFKQLRTIKTCRHTDQINNQKLYKWARGIRFHFQQLKKLEILEPEIMQQHDNTETGCRSLPDVGYWCRSRVRLVGIVLNNSKSISTMSLAVSDAL
jgi:hypothetical protein